MNTQYPVINTKDRGIIVAIKPWGGKHANLLCCLRPQRSDQFTGGNYPSLREAVLPVPGRSMRAYLGLRTDFQTLVAGAGAAHRHTPGRTHQKLVGGTAAGTVPASQLAAIGLIARPSSQPLQLLQVLSLKCPPRALLIISIESCIGMPAQQAYKPPAQSKLIHTISARRNPRSGRLPDKFAPKNLCSTARSSPRPLPLKFATRLGAPNYRFVLAGSPARSAGYPAWVQGTALPLGGRAARDVNSRRALARSARGIIWYPTR